MGDELQPEQATTYRALEWWCGHHAEEHCKGPRCSWYRCAECGAVWDEEKHRGFTPA